MRSTLTRQARETIKNWGGGVTIAAYVRYQGYDSVAAWGGDRCGCPDDRCIGYHHFDENDCGCLDVLLTQCAEGLARGFKSVLDEYSAREQGGPDA